MTSPFLNVLLLGYGVVWLGSWVARHRGSAWLARALRVVWLTTWAAHAGFIGCRWLLNQHPPFASLYDTLVFFAWSLLLSFVIVGWRPVTHAVSRGVLGVSLVALGFAFFMDASVAPLLPALQSHWIAIHVVSCFIGYGAFGVAFVGSLLWFVEGRRRRRDEAQAGLPVPQPEGIQASQQAGLQELMRRAVEFGFPFLTLGIIVGSIWANETWGTYWSWDPKETWALITWLIYAVVLHGTRIHRWSGSRVACLNVLGFLAVLFSFIGVNFLLSELHGYL